MSDKFILKDFTVLAVCPSEKWSTIERRAIFDCTYLRNIGGNPVLLCFEGSQIDIEAEKEDIPKIFIKRHKLTPYKDFNFIVEFRHLLNENRYDIVHCYDLSSMWISAFLMGRKQETPFFLTLNQNINSVYHNVLAKWLLKRVDAIFTLSQETHNFVCESFSIAPSHVKNIGSGIEIIKSKTKKTKPNKLGCVIDNMNELKRLSYIVKIFRFLKSHHKNKGTEELTLSLFLGPRIYQQDRAKKVLTEFDHEFYQGDIMLYSLENKKTEFKELDLLIGVAFDEPLNDYEIVSLINETPVLFPRTAMRQSLMFKYQGIAESYQEGDIREAISKIVEIIANYSTYRKALSKFSDEIYAIHGIDFYADKLEQVYEQNVEKRVRFTKKKKAS